MGRWQKISKQQQRKGVDLISGIWAKELFQRQRCRRRCGLVLLEMFLSSPICLVCCSHHGTPSNLLHRSDGFIEVPVKSIQKITM